MVEFDRDFVQQGNNTSVEGWKSATRNWQRGTAYLVKVLSEKPPAERTDIANGLKQQLEELPPEENTGNIDLLMHLSLLNQEALGRLTHALYLNEIEGKLQSPDN